MDTQALTDAIRAVRDRLVASGAYGDFAAINAGYCTDFANDVQEELGREACERLGVGELGIDNLMEHEDEEPTVMDRALLAEHWPAVVPPEGLDWDGVDALAAAAGFSCGTHVWLLCDGRHFDAEAPDGVDSPFDLPFFRRIVADWTAGGYDAPRP